MSAKKQKILEMSYDNYWKKHSDELDALNPLSSAKHN